MGGAAALLVPPVNVLLFRNLLKDESASRLPANRTVVRFSAGHTAVAVAGWFPDFLVPLLVLKYAGESESAYYYAAWTVAYSVRLLVVNMTSALVVEGAFAARAPALDASCIPAPPSPAVLLPSIGILFLGADLLLRFFGPDYSAAETLLRYFAVSLVPFAVIAFTVASERVHQQFGGALVAAAASITVVALNLELIPELGIEGAGVAWLIGQSVGAVVALAVLLVRLRYLRRRVRRAP